MRAQPHLLRHVQPRCSAAPITVTFPDPTTHVSLYLFVALAVAGLVLARRVPVLRVLVSVAGYVVLAGALVLLIDQRATFDPQLERLASLLRIEGQRVEGKETRLPMSPDGHFWVRATIDGQPRRLMVDSGATVTALSSETAEAAGLAVSDGPFPVLVRTANGTMRAQSANVDELRLGNVVARDLPVIVSSGMNGIDVLGMNFLSRLKGWRVEGRTLILTPHRPQPAEAS